MQTVATAAQRVGAHAATMEPDRNADRRAVTRATHLARQAVLGGGRAEPAPPTVITASWRRMRSLGLSPGGAPEIAPLRQDDLLHRRETSGLQPLVPLLREHLLPTCEATGQLLVVADPEGRVLWREGRAAVMHHADRLGFVGGSAWTEGNVGTNAIGTALVTEAPVHIHAAEHFSDSHTAWTCAAAPLHDPVDGRVLGVVDLSGPARTVHAGTLSMVRLAARLAQLELASLAQEQLEQLRGVGAPVLARLDGRGLVVSPDGRVAAASGFAPPARVALPDGLGAGEATIAGLGPVTAEPLPGGWLLRVVDDPDDAAVVALRVDLSGREPTVHLSGPSGCWTHRLTPRHAEIVLALAQHPAGRSAAELAGDLFGDDSRTVTVRAELSRLRKVLGPVLRHRPYRLTPEVSVDVVHGHALAGSSAPVVQRAARRA